MKFPALATPAAWQERLSFCHVSEPATPELTEDLASFCWTPSWSNIRKPSLPFLFPTAFPSKQERAFFLEAITYNIIRPRRHNLGSCPDKTRWRPGHPKVSEARSFIWHPFLRCLAPPCLGHLQEQTPRPESHLWSSFPIVPFVQWDTKEVVGLGVFCKDYLSTSYLQHEPRQFLQTGFSLLYLLPLWVQSYQDSDAKRDEWAERRRWNGTLTAGKKKRMGFEKMLIDLLGWWGSVRG